MAEEPLPGGFIAEVVRIGIPLPGGDLVDVMLDQIEGTWRGTDAGADRDEPGMRRLRAAGAVSAVRDWQKWLLRHRSTVEVALGTR